MKYQLQLMATAIMFFTRIPIPFKIPYSEKMLSQSSRYFPLVGLIIGTICASFYLLFSKYWSKEIAIIISMIFGVLVTGAFHEDGFCDSCDGLGGGQDKNHILTIMKDSRVGSFAAIGINLILFLKYFSLNAVDVNILALTMIGAHALSRFWSGLYIRFLPYARPDDPQSKSKPLATEHSNTDTLVAAFLGIIPLFLFLPLGKILLLQLILGASFLLIRSYFLKKVGGYTGDMLGASQQVFEVIIYLTLTIRL